MIVGTLDLDFDKIHDCTEHVSELCDYSDSLVPKWARHITPIVHNQRYYVAIHVRNMLTIPYKKRKEMFNELIADIHLKGVMSEFIPISDILAECDKELLCSAIQERFRNV